VEALLAAAREAIATPQAASDERSRKIMNLVVHSVYRDFGTDKDA
jgi:hypothetical protein